MIINPDRRNRNQSITQVIPLSDILKNNNIEQSDPIGVNVAKERFKRNIQQLNEHIRDDLKNQSTTYELQKIIRRTDESLLSIDTLWGYEPTSDYRIDTRGFYSPYIAMRVARKAKRKINKTLLIDTTDITLLTTVPEYETTTITLLERLIIENKNEISTVSVSDNIDILSKDGMNIFRAVLLYLSDNGLKYILDISRCKAVNQTSILERLKLYGSCEKLGITALKVNIALMTNIVTSKTNLDWLRVNKLDLELDENVYELNMGMVIGTYNVEHLILHVDFTRYEPDNLRDLNILLRAINARRYTIILSTDANLSLTRASLDILQKYKSVNPNIFIKIETPPNSISMDVYQKYGDIKGLVLKNSTCYNIIEYQNNVLDIMLKNNENKRLILRLLNQTGTLEIVNRIKQFERLSHQVLLYNNKIINVFNDIDDVVDYDYLSNLKR